MTFSFRPATDDAGPTLKIVAPCTPSWYRHVIVVFFLVVSSLMGLNLMGELRTGQLRQPYLLTVFLCAFAVLIAFGALVAYAWILWGREIVWATPSELGLRLELGRLSHTKLFRTESIGIIWLTPPAKAGWHSARHDPLGPGWFRHGHLEFDHEARFYRYGFDWDRDTAVKVLQALARVLPAKVILPQSSSRLPVGFTKTPSEGKSR